MISNKCLYALLALLELERNEGGRPITISHIARSRHIPARFLEAILRQLKQGGFTTSQRGKDGGYLLARDASQICVGDVIRHIEGPLSDQGNAAAKGIPESSRELFGELIQEACEALESVYNEKTIRDLALRETEISEQYVVNYSI